MVITNHAWEEETRRYLADIKTELDNVNTQLEALQAKRDALAHEAEALNTALAVHFRRTGRQETDQPSMREFLLSQPNHKERMKRIAERNNGILKVGQAANILFLWGIVKSKARMNVYRIVYVLAKDMVEEGIFEKSGPAEFRLLGTQTALPNTRVSLKDVTLKNNS